MAKWVLRKADGTEINFADLLDWRPLLQSEEVADDSDKVLTVPDKKEWEIRFIRVEIVATATVGTRQMEVQIRDAEDDIIWSSLGGTAVASATLIEHYAEVGGDVAMPKLIIPAGFDVHIFDNAAVDVAADDMVIQMLIGERDAP